MPLNKETKPNGHRVGVREKGSVCERERQEKCV